MNDIEKRIEDLSSTLGYTLHKSLRKSLDSKEACKAWDAINELHNVEWNIVCNNTMIILLQLIEPDNKKLKEWVKENHWYLDITRESKVY